VDAILEATTLIAAEEGEERLTTNHIAERAGVSIGTLYQYFPTREAIIDAIARQARARVVGALDALLLQVGRGEKTPHAMLREFVGIYLRAFDGRGPGGRTFARIAWRSDHLDAIVHSAREASERIALHLQRAQLPGLRQPTPAQAFVLTRSLMGTLRAAVLEDSPLLGSQAFEDELVRMCWGLLVQPA
jgi:AcrR family transcriptional regulator